MCLYEILIEIVLGKEFWTKTINQYRELLKLLKTVNNFVSPLIFIWVSYNIFGLTMQVCNFFMYFQFKFTWWLCLENIKTLNILN